MVRRVAAPLQLRVTRCARGVTRGSVTRGVAQRGGRGGQRPRRRESSPARHDAARRQRRPPPPTHPARSYRQSLLFTDVYCEVPRALVDANHLPLVHLENIWRMNEKS